LAAVFLIVMGCSSTQVEMNAISQTHENLTRLNLGYTEVQVLEIMGSPDKIKQFPRYAKHLVYWLYLSQEKDATGLYYNDGNYTFLAFENGVLRAWGKDYEVIPFQKSHPLWQSE
jgi:outer membrane protein assembly factor BamE (lipoprotein component of BamABCDE complex)